MHTHAGINETIGYTTIAVATEIAAAILDTNYPRTGNYYVVIGLIVTGLLLGVFVLKESKPVVVAEEAVRTKREASVVENDTDTTLQWPSGRRTEVKVWRSAFVYTSFLNKSLVAVCFAGLMINFISGFVWSLMKKWMKAGQADVWYALCVCVRVSLSLCVCVCVTARNG